MARLAGATVAPADYFDAPDDLVSGSGNPFADAFTEYWVLPDGPFGFVPMPDFGTAAEDILQTFGDKWCRTEAGTYRAPNHQLLVIGDTDSTPGGAPQASSTGVTVSRVIGETSSWVWRGAIEYNAGHQGSNPGADPDMWAAKTAAHELAHEWRANSQFNLFDHCPTTTTAYNDASISCLMADYSAAVLSQRANGIARFHLLNLGNQQFHSEYLEIRRHPDPFLP
jgi:hypothetical protein